MQAISLDETFGPAYALVTRCYCHRKTNNWPRDIDRIVAETRRFAALAVEFGRDDAICLSEAGYALAFIAGDLASGTEYTAQALSLNPNFAAAWMYGGWVKLWSGDATSAVERFLRAIRTSPVDPALFGMQSALGHAYFQAGRYDDAITWAEKALRQQPRHLPGVRIAAASLAMAGRLAEARHYVSEMLKISPTSRVSNLREICGPYSAEEMGKYEEGVRRAGLPE